MMKNIAKYFIPRYDELTLYLHGLTFFLLIGLSSQFRKLLLVTLPHLSGRAYILESLVFIGAGISIVNAVVPREKSDIEKNTMLSFAIVSNLLVAVYVVVTWMDSGKSNLHLSDIPVLFNVAYSILLGILWKFNVITDASISDAAVSHYQVAMATLPILLAFIYCQFILKAAWPITYSWCVFASFISKDGLRIVASEVIFAGGTAANGNHGPRLLYIIDLASSRAHKVPHQRSARRRDCRRR